MKRRVFVALGLAALGLAALPAQHPELEKDLIAAFQKGMALHQQGKHAEALEHLNRAVELAPKVFGDKHVNTGSICGTAGYVHSLAGRMEEAEKLQKRSVAIHEGIPGNEKRLARGLANLSATQDSLGKYAEAEKNVRRAIDLEEKLEPREDLELALSHFNYGALLHRVGRYAESEAPFLRCIELRLGKLAKDDPAVLDAQFALGIAYRDMRRDKEAETLSRRVLEMRKARLGPDHLQVSESHAELGRQAFTVGDFPNAEKHLQEALRIRTKLFGKDDPGSADLLQSMAMVYTGTSRPGEAETYHRKGLALMEKQFGADHPRVAIALANLADLYSHLGRYEETEKLLLRAVKIRSEKTPDHPLFAVCLNNLGGLYQHLGRYKEAHPLFQRALEINEKTYGKDHIQTATTLNNLAVLYSRSSDPAAALPLYERTLKIQETHYGPDHVHAGTTLGNMALVYARLGKFAEADKLADKTIEIFKRHVKVQGRTYLEGALHSRAEILFAMGKVREGMQAEEESLSLYQYELGKVFAFSSEANMHAFVERKNGYVPTLVNMALQARDDATTTQVFDWTLRLKGMIFDTLCRYRQAQNLLSKDEDLRESVARFRSHKEFLANMALNPPAGKDAARVQKEIDKVQGEAAELEKELTRAIAQKIPDVVAGRENITSEQVRKRLPADGALIEFVRVSMRDFKKEGWGDIHYVAFVLTPDMKAPKLVDLGPAKEIDALIEVVRKEFTDFQEKLKDCESAEEVRDLEKAQEKQFAARCAPLYKLLFAPVRKELGKASLLYLAPDGAINRLPFEALVDADGKYLVENYRCAYVSSGRDLLRTVHEPAKGTVVFANPDFKLDAEERLARVEKLLPKKEINLALRGQSSAELRSAGWKNLPGAAAEAKDIQKLLGEGKYGPVKSHVGPDALEELLKAMPAPRVLHLATHGFFLDRATDDKPPADEGAGAGWARGRLKRMDNPLLRSGIVLAGANTIGDKDVAARVEDGWVTAEEIALLNLNGTELVVLSACQTGLGDIKSGEGVQGLRRAFLHAGAQTLVTSLFEVPDAETRHLMNRFYANYNGGAGKLRALHAAQRGFIDDRRKTQGAAHPFFWASFVLVGSPD